jgi:branched-chain amino acid transport system substrate-binding protein
LRRSVLALVVSFTLVGLMFIGNVALAQPVVKIGAIFPLTGASAATGVKLKYAVEVAEEIINGLHPDIDVPLARTSGLPKLSGARVQFVFADHQGNPEIAKSEAERLIQNEKVVALIGCYQSSATKPASAVAERYGVPFIAGSSSSAALTERGLKWFMRIAPNDDMETKFFFDYLKFLNQNYNAGIKRVGVVFIDNEYGVHAAEMVDKWIETYKKDGFELAARIKYPTTVSNVDTEVQRVKAARLDAIFHASYIADITQFVKGYRAYDVTPKAVLNYCGGFQDPKFLENLGRDANYFSGSNAIASSLFAKMEVAKRINDLYKPKAGVDIDGPTIEDFSSALVMADAINEAGSTDPARVLEVLKTKTFYAPYFVSGKVKFDDKGQNEYSASVMVQVLNGVYEAVWPVEFKTAEPVPAFPPWRSR